MARMELIYLDALPRRDRDTVGGKALGLARMFERGLPVPPGFVIPARAYRRLADVAGLDRAQCETLDNNDLIDAFSRIELPAMLVAAARALGPRLAVRSSGLDEDGADASHAGQYLSVIDVPPEGVPDAVRACWASAHSARARSYRGGGVPTDMAVVVQRLINPRCAGVLFTVNPLSGSWGEMTVEAAWGQGEAVVSGRVVPDFYRVQRPRRTPEPVQRVLARVRLHELEARVHPQQEQAGGEPVAPSLVHARKLPRRDLLRLCRLGLRAEATLGGPCDAEWALDGEGQFWLLQARPVTALTSHRPTAVVWTRRFVGERWTEPATPLGWSLMRDLLAWFIAYPETSRRFLGGEAPMRISRAAPYFNVTVFRHLAFKLPGAAPPRFMIELLPEEEERGWLRRRAAAPDLRVYHSILSETFAERRWQRFRWNPFRNWRAWQQFEGELDRSLAGLSDTIEDIDDARARARVLHELARGYIKVHICSLLFANIWFEATRALLDAQGLSELAPAVLRPAAESWTVRANKALWALGRGIVPLSEVQDSFGHRAASSWELFSERWAENPERVRLLARAAATGADPSVATAARLQETAATTARLPEPLRRAAVLTQRYLLLREDQRYHFDRLLWKWKQTYLWMEAELGLAIRYLEARELDALLDRDLARADATELVRRREAELQLERQRRLAGDEPPDFMVGDQVILVGGTGHRLQGQGISPGSVTGTVRVIRVLDQADRLREGDILVTRATDPSWTPLFLKAGGLIMELGGMLSHGAVVAREYRLPAVVNLQGATSRLRDGQTVTVDGARGVVWVH